MENFANIINNCGFYQFGTVNPTEVKFRDEIRKMCEVNTCRLYGKTWACPPAVGTIPECRDRVQKYDTLMVLTGKYELEDSFDFEGMQEGQKKFRESCRALNEVIGKNFENYLMLSNEGCDLCKECTYPNAPCRFPKRAMGSLEAYGIFVSELANQAGVKYNNGPNTVTYLGAFIYNKEDFEKFFEL